MKVINNLNEFIEKVDDSKKVNPLDLSQDQDLTIAIMNLISIEEHLVFSGAKTKDNNFFDLIEEIREVRKELLQKIIKTYKGEVWCISKHLLATSMRLMEVGTKLLHQNTKKEAYDFFNKAYDMYCLFWGLNLNDISDTEAKKTVEELRKNLNININSDKNTENEKDDIAKEKIDNSLQNNKKEDLSLFNKLKFYINKAVDCCKE